jgi:hypothetical protein
MIELRNVGRTYAHGTKEIKALDSISLFIKTNIFSVVLVTIAPSRFHYFVSNQSA